MSHWLVWTGREDAAGRQGRVRLLLAAAALVVAAGPLTLLAVAARSAAGPVPRLDHRVVGDLHAYALRHSAYTSAWRAVSAVGGVMWWVVLTPVAGWLLAQRRGRMAAFVAVTAVGSSGINALVKTIVRRPRPALTQPVASAHGSSFPSGHAQAAFVGAAILLIVFLSVLPYIWRSLALAAGGAVVSVIAFSRIALGVHYPSDLVGSVLVGATWLLVTTAVFLPWSEDRLAEDRLVSDVGGAR